MVSDSDKVLDPAFTRVSKPYVAAERTAMFHDTAVRVYRIEGGGPRIAGNLPSLFGCEGPVQPAAHLDQP
jgi:hypothetical protein